MIYNQTQWETTELFFDGNIWAEYILSTINDAIIIYDEEDMKVLVIIPAYNEALNIVNTVNTLTSTCPEVDYVVVNDCSQDDTAAICKKNGFNGMEFQ